MIKLLLVSLLAFATALTWSGADGAAARDRDSSSSSNSSSTSERHSDQDEARDAVRKGKIMPLTAILEIVAKREPGTVMEVELETKRGKLIYQLEVLTDSGRRREIRLDARNGDVLWAGDD